MPWQQDLADQALECDPDTGLLVYRTVVCTVPRQSGKSTLILAKNIARMVDARSFGGRQRLVYTAQDRISAKQKLMDDFVEDLRAAKRFNGRWRERRVIGEESVKWENGSRWGIQANKETSGHGGTIDVADLDEAFAHVDDRVEQALSPAMITRDQAQLWVVSTAGNEKSIYLKGKVDAGRLAAEAGVDRGVLYCEYSADPAQDPEDPATWRGCMPALGLTVAESVIRDELEKLGPRAFCRAYLNLWVPASFGEQVIPAADWEACADPESQIVGSKVVLSVDVAPGSAWAAVAVAGLRADGLPHGEVIEHQAGDSWVIPRLKELRESLGRRTPIVVDPAGPASGLLAEMQRLRFNLVTTTARDMSQACVALKSASQAHSWRHLGQSLVTDALKCAASRTLLDSWAWKRTSSAGDICPLVAVTLALHGLSTLSAGKPAATDEELLASVG